jgi:hypothetical protein
MSDNTSIIPREMPKLACGAVVAIGYAAAFISVSINARYGQRMSVDVDGYYLQSALLLVLSLGPAILTSYSGFAWRARTWLKATGAFVFAAALMVFSAWNVNDFVASQMLGKARTAEYQQQTSKDLAEVRNTLTLEERKELRDSLLKKYGSAKSKEDRDDAMAKLEALSNRPVDLQVAMPNVAPDARSDTLKKWFGTDRETIQSIAPVGAALFMVLVELFCPFLGFSGWPTSRSEAGGSLAPDKDRRAPRSKPLAPLKPRTSKQAAYEELKVMLAGGKKVESQASLARKWGVSEPTVHLWLAEWGVVKEPATTAFGRRNVITSLNGNGRLLTQ